MRLAEFILANIEPILADWEAFARSVWPGKMADAATLRDHAGAILRATAEDMKSAQSDSQQADKSTGGGHRSEEGLRLNGASGVHALGRVSSGFDMMAVVAEYRALRASVTRLWREAAGPVDPRDMEDLIRFNESMDQSLTTSVKRPGSIGLGLYIAREIVTAHGGSIDVRSSAEEGTVFTVRLPRRAATC